MVAPVAEVAETVGHENGSNGNGHHTIIPYLLKPTGLPDPDKFKNANKAAEKIFEKFMAGEKILLVIDEDADGICSGAIMYRLLRQLRETILAQQIFTKENRKSYTEEQLQDHYDEELSKFYEQVQVYIPNRYREQYGPSITAFQKAAEEEFGVVVCMDCGTSSLQELKFANNRGLDVVVLDHHSVSQELEKSYPEHTILVNPDRYENRPREKDKPKKWNKDEPTHICAAAVTMVAVRAIRQQYKKWIKDTYQCSDEEAKKYAMETLEIARYMPLVGIATYADARLMFEPNRGFVNDATDVLQWARSFYSPEEFIASGGDVTPALWYLSKQVTMAKPYVKYTDIGNLIAPLLNSPKRLSPGTSAGIDSDLQNVRDNFEGFEFARTLSGHSPHYPYIAFAAMVTRDFASSKSLMQTLGTINKTRHDYELSYFNDAENQIKKRIEAGGDYTHLNLAVSDENPELLERFRQHVAKLPSPTTPEEAELYWPQVRALHAKFLEWNESIIDLVARDLSASNDQPSIVITCDLDGNGIGWARGLQGKLIRHLIAEAADIGMIEQFGRTNRFKIRKEKIDAFAEFIDDRLAEQAKEQKKKNAAQPRPIGEKDWYISADQVNLDYIRNYYNSYGPFGIGNPRPLVLLNELMIIPEDTLPVPDESSRFIKVTMYPATNIAVHRNGTLCVTEYDTKRPVEVIIWKKVSDTAGFNAALEDLQQYQHDQTPLRLQGKLGIYEHRNTATGELVYLPQLDLDPKTGIVPNLMQPIRGFENGQVADVAAANGHKGNGTGKNGSGNGNGKR